MSHEREPIFLIIEGSYGFINGKRDHRFELPTGDNGYNIGDIEQRFLAACAEYDYKILDDEQKLHRIVLKAFEGKKAVAASLTTEEKEHALQDNSNTATPADVLFGLARSEISEMFKDSETMQCYAVLNYEGKTFIHDMESSDFKHKLRLIYANHIESRRRGDPTLNSSALISEDALNKVVHQLIAGITDVRPLYLRCYFDGAGVYYHLANAENEFVMVTERGYSIEKGSWRYFRPLDPSREQVRPVAMDESEKGGIMLDQLLKSFNLVDNKDGDKTYLLKVDMISRFVRTRKGITLPILAIDGPEGSSKTTLAITIKYHVDPIAGNPKAMANRWGLPEQSRDRGLTIAKNYVTIFDNISYLAVQESDELCTYATGVRWQERKLHTNIDTIEYTLQGHVAYTSINDVARQGDLISRQIQLSLNLRTSNMSEIAFWEAREYERPFILGYIFSVLSKAIPIYKRLRAEKKDLNHRLADSIILYEAISQAIGERPGRIEKIFEELQDEQGDRLMSNNAFNDFFREFCFSEFLLATAQKDLNRDDVYHVEVTPKTLLSWMKEYAQVSDPTLLDAHGNWKDKDFPTSAHKVGNRIAKLRAQLSRMGIHIPEKPDHGRKGSKYAITIEKPGNSKRD